MTENKDALEPCPFCGAVATVCVGRASDDSALAFVTCGTCGVNGMNFKNSYTPVSEAIAAWNTRATPPAQDAMREALMNCVSALCSVRKNYEEPGFGIWDDVSRFIVDGNAALSTPQPESVDVRLNTATLESIAGAVSDDAIRHLQIRSPLNRAIFATLRNHRMGNMGDEDGFGYPLVDLMSDPAPACIGTGEMEMVALADDIEAAATCNDGLQVALAEAIEALRVARSWFDFYARNHRVAGKLDKAARNQQLADMTARVVAKHGEGR